MARRHGWAQTALATAVPLGVALIGKLPELGTKAATPPPVVIVDRTVAPAPAPAAAPAAAAIAAPAAAAPLPPVDPVDPACLPRFDTIGLPSPRGDDAAAKEAMVCRRGYVLGYDVVTRDPDWVVEHLTAGDLTGKASRSDKFGPDPALHGRDADLSDYSKSGYDRGHQAPAGDAKFDQKIMDQSFFLSNMAPQIGIGFNRGAWKYLEETVRAWILCGGHQELYVITGPVYAGSKYPPIGHDQVVVPAQFFKIVYDPASARALGFLLPNQKIGSTVDLQKYVVPIADIETETGLDFFPAFDRRRQTMLEGAAGTVWGHASTCSGNAGD